MSNKSPVIFQKMTTNQLAWLKIPGDYNSEEHDLHGSSFETKQLGAGIVSSKSTVILYIYL